jgi:hypothetical protein
MVAIKDIPEGSRILVDRGFTRKEALARMEDIMALAPTGGSFEVFFISHFIFRSFNLF